METTGGRILRRWGTMDAEFMRHATVWRHCLDATFPELADGLNGDVVDAQSAQNKKAENLDSTGTDAARTLTSTILSGMTPANSVWFGLDVGEESDEEKRFLDGSAKRMWEAIHGSNFDATKFDAVLFAVCAGWFVMYIDDDAETGELRFQQWPISQCRIAASRQGGAVDTVYRRFKLTAEQAVAEYGDKVSEKVRSDAELKPDTPHEFIHAIYPRTDYSPGRRMARNLPVASVHVECSTKEAIRESGYHESPLVVPRWMLLPNSPYAVGPVSAALPHIRELNELLRLEAAGLARAVAGVYVAEDDGVLNPRTVKVKGGSVIVANSVDSIKELPSGADFNAAFSKAEVIRAEIRRVMMADQLPPMEQSAKTATEFHYRANMVRMLLGPVFGRFQSEDLSPMVERVFGLMYRRGRPELGGAPGPILLDDAPESLMGVPFRVRFQSPLARAQKLEDVNAMERLTMMAGTLAQIGKTGALDLLDEDEMMRAASDALGAPEKTLRDEKKLAAHREAQREAAAAQEQKAMQQQQQMAATDAMMQRAATA
jgi:hypothetical protein